MSNAKSRNRARAVKHAAELVRSADAILIAAGAGMSVDSGLPAFRSYGGLWTTLMPTGIGEHQIGSLTRGDCFTRQPEQAWAFYGRALAVCQRTAPHDGYRLISQWAAKRRYGSFVYTSNVDGHFQAAGFREDRVVECHGTIHRLHCATPCSDRLWHTDSLTGENAPALPACPNCGGLARPNFLLFGDDAWVPTRTLGQLANLRKWISGTERAIAIEIGAGQAVPSVRMFAESFGTPLIRINLHDEHVDSDTATGIRGTALAVLQEIAAGMARDA